MSTSHHRPTPIFLFSLPRSGSTLCQRIIATHESVATVNEPHILLPMLHALRDDETRSTYNHFYASHAIQDFCSYLPHGENDYLASVRDQALDLYARASQHNEPYFLDKTPKYHFIAEEIITLFPEGKFVFLWRNPLAVIASLVQTWGGGYWNVHHFKVDLLKGIDNLINAYLKHEHQVHSFRYEDAVAEPKATWSQVFAYLGLPFHEQALTTFSTQRLRGRVRDPNSDLEEYQVILEAPLDKWRTTLNNPLRRAWCRRYLRWLGHERLEVMGYCLEDLLAELDGVERRLDHVVTDAVLMPIGAAYHTFEIQLIKQKVSVWRHGEPLFMHS